MKWGHEGRLPGREGELHKVLGAVSKTEDRDHGCHWEETFLVLPTPLGL